MKIKKYRSWVIFILIFMVSCRQNNHNSNPSIYMSSIDSLKRISGFTLKIKAGRWGLENMINENGSRMVPELNDYSLYADIECEIADYKKFKEGFTKNKSNLLNQNVYLKPTFIKSWFSKEVKSVLYKENNYLRVNTPTYNLNTQIVGKTFFSGDFFCFVGANRILLVIDR